MRPQTHRAMLETLPYFEGRSLILAPHITQGKRFFCVLLCCIGSAVYLGGGLVKKLEKILCSEAHFLRLKQSNTRGMLNIVGRA